MYLRGMASRAGKAVMIDIGLSSAKGYLESPAFMAQERPPRVEGSIKHVVIFESQSRTRAWKLHVRRSDRIGRFFHIVVSLDSGGCPDATAPCALLCTNPRKDLVQNRNGSQEQ